MSHLFSKPVLAPEFYCSKCGKYKPTEARCSSLLCCRNCKEKVLAADVSNKTEAVKEEKVLSHALKLKNDLDDKMYQRELSRAISDEWMI